MEQEQMEQLNLKNINIEIIGTLQIPKDKDITEDKISLEFVDWCESKGYYFAGKIEVVE